jgi:hypothetical protein
MKDPYRGRAQAQKSPRQGSPQPDGKTPKPTKAGQGLGDVTDSRLTGKGSPWSVAHGAIKERKGSAGC